MSATPQNRPPPADALQRSILGRSTRKGQAAAGQRALRESLNDPSTSTLNMSPFSKSVNRSQNSSIASSSRSFLAGSLNRSQQHQHKQDKGTGSTVRPGTRSLYGDIQDTNSIAEDDSRVDLGQGPEEQLDMVDRLRFSRNDAMQQHLYSTAAFWGNKAFELTGDPNDAFWLAQVLFLTHQFARAERILTLPRRDTEEEVAKGKEPEKDAPEEENDELGNGWFRLVDLSIACRYLAAQCLIRQNKWSEALDLLGPVNPFKQSPQQILPNGSIIDAPLQQQQQSQPVASTSFDGGIKFEASLCHLRGLIQLHFNSTDKAKESFLEALSIDVKCFESLEALIDGNMLTVDEEWNFIQALRFKAQLDEEDAEFVKMAYTVRLKKYKHHDEFARCRDVLSSKYGLSKDPDVLFGLADELFAGQKWTDCYAVTSTILSTHEGHGPTLPLHLACMYHLPSLHPRLFLDAHDLVDKSPDSAMAWYAVGLWYFSQKRWDEARRFFGKAVLLDNRFGPAWIAFAHAYALEGEHDQSITAYSTAQRHFQGTHLPMLFIGMQHLQLSNFNLGKEYLSTAWEMCQDDPLLANEMGISKFGEEHYDEAISYFQLAITLVQEVQGDKSPWMSTYVNLGHALRKVGRLREAQTAFEQAIDLDYRPAAPFTGLGYVLLARRQRTEAIQMLHEALARTPGEPIASELLSLAIQDQTESMFQATSKSGVVRFPYLSDQTAEAMDQAVVEMDQRVAHMADPLETQRSDESMEQDMQDVSNSLEMSMETQNA